MTVGHQRIWVERFLALGGAVLLIAALTLTLRATWYQRTHIDDFERDTAAAADAPTFQPGAPIGRLEIPRLGLRVVVAEGDDDGTLSVAAGHLPDTPFPWERGNSAFAAHRDSLFRPLARIRLGDRLQVTTSHGSFSYRVVSFRIVAPTDLSVLQPSADSDTVTLITCYPFHYVGNAPHRFVVRAARQADFTTTSTAWPMHSRTGSVN